LSLVLLLLLLFGKKWYF